MGSDRFPEAFRRFEQQVSLRNIVSFKQLTLAMASWAGPKCKYTRKQMEALADEAQRRGIPVYEERRERERLEFTHKKILVYKISLNFNSGKNNCFPFILFCFHIIL